MDDPFGLALYAVFTRVFLGGTRWPDILTFGALLFGLLAAICLPLSVRAVPATASGPSRVSRAGRALATLLGLALPGAFDLLAGRAARGALQALLFGLCYAVARAARGEGLLAQTLVGPDRWGYFGDVPAGVAYLEAPALANAAALVMFALLLVNIPLTLRQARRAGVFGTRVR